MNPKKKENKFSKLRLKTTGNVSKNISPVINPREKISSYFSLNTSETDLQNSCSSSAQFGQNIELDEDDFVSKVVEPSKIFEIKIQKNSKVKKLRKKNDLSRFVKDLGPSCSDTNTEHLHLALALSKSLQDDSENSQENSESPYPSTQNKISAIKRTLDQFGFKSDRSAVDLPIVKNKRQKKKFKYTTPTLYLRTDEDRNKLIENKVSGILTNISVYNKTVEENDSCINNSQEFISNKPISFMLRDYYDENSTVFSKNSLSLGDINVETFYNKIVPNEIVKTGLLLKDWKKIPGREMSPPVNITVEETQDLLNEEQNLQEKNKLSVDISAGRSISPDLFSDSDTELSNNKSPKVSLNYLNKLPNNTINLPTNNKHLNSSPNKSPDLSLHNKNSNLSPSKSQNLLPDSVLLSPNNKRLNLSLILVSSTSNSPIILDSCYNKDSSPILNENEIFSDDSSAKSLSLLDNISPKRNKISPKKNKSLVSKKCLFGTEKINSKSLINGVNLLKSPKNNLEDKYSSPFNSFKDNSQICHYESFLDNSNDYLNLTQSSDSNSDILKTNTLVSENLFSENVTEKPHSNFSPKGKEILSSHFSSNNLDANTLVSENLFSSENVTEMGAHDHNFSAIFRECSQKNKEIFVDLTQSSTESDEIISGKAKNIEEANLPANKIFSSLNFNEINNTVGLQTEENNSNTSIETVLLNKNYISGEKDIFEDEEIDVLNYNNKQDNSLEKHSTSVINDSENEIQDNISTIKNKLEQSVNHNISKRINKSLKRSFSENIGIKYNSNETNFFKLSSPLNMSKFLSQTYKNTNKSLTKEQNDNFSDSLYDIEISDEELNYSVSHRKKSAKNKSKQVYDLFKNKSCADSDHSNEEQLITNKNCENGYISQESSSDEELKSTSNSFRIKARQKVDTFIDNEEIGLQNYIDFADLPYTGIEPSILNLNETLNSSKHILKHSRVQKLNTPVKTISYNSTEDNLADVDKEIVKTPKNIVINQEIITPNNKIIVKTSNITPMPNYNEMNSPQLKKELDKFGIKPMKRTKGIKILQYIYDETHPIIEKNISSDEENTKIVKRRKTNDNKDLEIRKEILNCEKIEEMIFERKLSSKISSCMLPLHIAWNNLIYSSIELQEKILLYEPIQIEEIYTKFKSLGFKYHIQDIIAFLDKKCVTIKIAQNQKKSK